MTNKIIPGDCNEVLKTFSDNYFDSIVTDPPYGISFMNKHWDYDVPSVDIWREVLRVLKPGGHLLSFGGTRTYHRMVVNIEDAGFEIRDQVQYIYGSGFPKSLDIRKAIDKLGGQSLSWFIDYIINFAQQKGINKKELTMLFPSRNGNPTGWLWNKQKTQGITVEQFNVIKNFLKLPFENIEETKREIIGRGKAGLTAGTIANFSGEKEFNLTKGNSEWEGWGTGLKPANEPICFARKPISENTIAENVLKWGTGGINIDGCRIKAEIPQKKWETPRAGIWTTDKNKTSNLINKPKDRFPANVIHDGSEEVIKAFPDTKSGLMKQHIEGGDFNCYGKQYSRDVETIGDSGSASRFFYCAKASKSERNKGLEEMEDKFIAGGCQAQAELKRGNINFKSANEKKSGYSDVRIVKNNHPTVKPISLMRYLCKLITPPEGIVCDPYMGSGSTGIACKLEGFSFVGIEREKQYCLIARARIKAW